MSWNVTVTNATRQQARNAISKEHAGGHMPDSHRAALEAEVDAAPAYPLNVSSNGSRHTPAGTGGSLTISVSKA